MLGFVIWRFCSSFRISTELSFFVYQSTLFSRRNGPEKHFATDEQSIEQVKAYYVWLESLDQRRKLKSTVHLNCNGRTAYRGDCFNCILISSLGAKEQKEVNQDSKYCALILSSQLNGPFAQLLPGLETGHPVTVGQSPAYDFSVSDEQQTVFLVSVSDCSVRDSCAGDWPTVTGCPVSNPGNNCANGLSLRFQASGDAEIKTVPKHFARANQADRCKTLLHCAQRLTPWLLDTRGWDRKSWVLFFVWALRDASTLPVGTWSSALDQSFRSHYNRLLRTSQSHYFVLRGKRNKLFR